MGGLDPRTLIVSASVSSALMAVVFLFQSRTFPPGIRGLREWGWGCLTIFVAALLVGLRGLIPDFISIVIGNLALQLGLQAFHVGLLRFHGRRVPRRMLWALLVLCFVLLSYTLYGQRSFNVRTVFITACNASIVAASVVLMLREHRISHMRFSAAFTLSFLAAVLFTSAGRGLVALAAILEPDRGDLFSASPIQVSYLAAYAVSAFGLAVGLILMAHDRLRDQLQHLVIHDHLTGVLTRRAFEERAEVEISRSRRARHDLALLVMDIDDFKVFNDSHGHLAGDQALTRFAKVAQDCLRREDLLGRMGGEEFLVLLPETGLDAACAAAERIRSAVAAARFEDGERDDLRITISIGVAAAGEDASYADLVRRADEAVYKAKASGRNRVQVA